MMATPDDNRKKRVDLHDRVDGVFVAQMVRRVFAPVEGEQDVGVHNEYVGVLADLIPGNKYDDACMAMAKSLLEIARNG